MIRFSSKRESRIVALGLLLATVGAIYFLAVSPYLHSWQYYMDKQQRLSTRVARHQRLIDASDAIEKELQIIEQKRKKLGLYLEAQTPALAAAVLQQAVKEAIANDNGRLISTQIVSANEVNKDDRPFVSLRVRMTADLATVRNVLYSLETDHTFLFLDNVYIRNNRSSGLVRPRTVSSGMLDVGFDVRAYLAGDPQ